MISKLNPDQTPKSPALYDWQTVHQIDDDSPMLPLGAAVFSMVGQLPQLPDEVAQETQALLAAAAEGRSAAAIARDAQQAAAAEVLSEIDTRMARVLDMLQHVELRTETVQRVEAHLISLAPRVAAAIDFEMIAAPVNDKMKLIIEKLKMDELQVVVDKLVAAQHALSERTPALQQLADAVRRYRLKHSILVILLSAIGGAAIAAAVVLSRQPQL